MLKKVSTEWNIGSVLLARYKLVPWSLVAERPCNLSPNLPRRVSLVTLDFPALPPSASFSADCYPCGPSRFAQPLSHVILSPMIQPVTILMFPLLFVLSHPLVIQGDIIITTTSQNQTWTSTKTTTRSPTADRHQSASAFGHPGPLVNSLSRFGRSAGAVSPWVTQFYPLVGFSVSTSISHLHNHIYPSYRISI